MADKTFSFEEGAHPDSNDKQSPQTFSFEEGSHLEKTDPTSIPATDDGAGWALARSAARAVVPGVVGTATAIPAAAAGTFVGGPVGTAVGGVGGAIAGSTAAETAQTALADKYAPDSWFGSKSAEADAKNHPVASTIGGLLGFGKPSLKAPLAAGKALLTQEGRQGLSLAAKNAIPFTKSAKEFAQKAAVAGSEEAKASEAFGHVVGSAAGVGVGTAQGIMQGADPLSAAGHGALGLAFEPWVGPHTFLGQNKGNKALDELSQKTGKKTEDQTQAKDTLAAEDQADFKPDADVKAAADQINGIVSNLIASDSPATASAVSEGAAVAAKVSSTIAQNEDKTTSQQSGDTSDQAGKDATASDSDSTATTDTSGQSQVVNPELTQPPINLPSLDEVPKGASLPAQQSQTQQQIRSVNQYLDNRGGLGRLRLNERLAPSDKYPQGQPSLSELLHVAVRDQDAESLQWIHNEMQQRMAKPSFQKEQMLLQARNAIVRLTGQEPVAPTLKVSGENNAPRVIKGGPEITNPALKAAAARALSTEQNPPAVNQVETRQPEVTEPTGTEHLDEVEPDTEDQMPDPLPAEEGDEQGEKEFIDSVNEQYPGQYTHDILQSLYRAKDSDQFTQWATTHYPDIAKNPAIAKSLYSEFWDVSSSSTQPAPKRIDASDAAHAKANELGIDIVEVTPSNGTRITVNDVKEHFKDLEKNQAEPESYDDEDEQDFEDLESQGETPKAKPNFWFRTPEAEAFLKDLLDQREKAASDNPAISEPAKARLAELQLQARENPNLLLNDVVDLNDAHAKSFDFAGVPDEYESIPLTGAEWADETIEPRGDKSLRRVVLPDGRITFVDLNSIPEGLRDYLDQNTPPFDQKPSITKLSKLLGVSRNAITGQKTSEGHKPGFIDYGMPTGSEKAAKAWYSKYVTDKRFNSETNRAYNNRTSLDREIGEGGTASVQDLVGDGDSGDLNIGGNIAQNSEVRVESITDRALAHMDRKDVPLSRRIAVGQKILEGAESLGLSDEELIPITAKLKKLESQPNYAESKKEAESLIKQNNFDAEQLMDNVDGNGKFEVSPLRAIDAGSQGDRATETPITRGEPIRTIHAGDLLTQVQQSQDASTFARVVAGFLNRSRARLEKIPTDIYNTLEDGRVGEYDRATKRIGLPEDFHPDVALHEILHALTQGGGFHSAEIKRLFIKIRNEAVKRGITSEEKWTRAADPTTALNATDEDIFHYAFSSPDELIAGMLHPQVREVLNSIPIRDGITGKLSNAWEMLKARFLEALGFRVKPGSALDKYLTHVMELAAPGSEAGDKDYYTTDSHSTLDTEGGNGVLYANDHVKKDPYFRSRTSIVRGSQEGGQGALEQTPQIQRSAREVAYSGSQVGDAAFAVLADKGLVGRNISKLSEAQIRKVSDALSHYLTASEEELSLGKTTNEKRLAEAIRKFREIVPLVPSEEIARLTQSEADSGLMLDQVQEMYENGALSDDKYAKVLNELARQNGIKIGNDLDAASELLRKHLENHQSSAAKWVLEGEGAESKAYKDDRGVVYKLSPVRQDVLGIAPINERSLNLTDHQPALFDKDGRIPLFDRLIAANSMPGHSPTEIAGITTDGRIILKQPYLGREESETSELVQAAIDSGVEVLPTQKEDPRFGGDVNTAPIMFTIDGEPWLALDYNSRNARSVEGRAVPFDLVFKKLTAKEIATNPDLREAAVKLADIQRTREEGEKTGKLGAIRKATTAGQNDRDREIDPTRPQPMMTSASNAETTDKMASYINSFKNTDEAYDALLNLSKDPTLARSMGIDDNEVQNGLKQLQKRYQNQEFTLKQKANPTPEDLVNIQTAKARNAEITDRYKGNLSMGAKVTQEGANIKSIEKTPQDFVDAYQQATLGGKLTDLGNGKLNIANLVQGIKEIKRNAAETAVDAAGKVLEKFGITDSTMLSQLKTILGGVDTTRAQLKSALAYMMTGATPESVEAATQQLTYLYNQAAQKIARTELPKEVHAAYTGSMASKIVPMTEKLGKYISLGKFNEDQIHQTLLESLGLQGYNADFVSKIRQAASFIQTLPEGHEVRNDALTMLNGTIANEILAQKIKAGGWSATKAVVGTVLPDLFRSAILTGPQTFLTHGFSGFLNVRLQGGFNAFGHFLSSVRSGNSVNDSFGYIKDFLDTAIGSDKGARNKPLASEFNRAWRTGKISQGLADGIGKRGADLLASLDLKSDNIDGKIGNKALNLYSSALGFLPRFMMAFDAINAGTASEMQQRWAMRAALLNGGLKSEEIATAMQKQFAPTTEDLKPAYDKLEEEVNQGFFNGVTGYEKKAMLAARLEQIQKENLPPAALGMAKDISKATKDWTLKGDAKGFYGMLAGIIGDVNKRTGVTQFMFPFVRIISNLMNNSLDYTPLGLMRANNASLSNMILGESKYAFDPMVKGSPEQIALASKSLLGTVIATAITTLFLKELKDEEETGKKPNFMFYGTGPKDPAKRGEWMASGARPNTLKVGDTYFPYKAIPGVDLLGTMLGTMHDYLAYENPLPKLPHGQQYTKEQLAEHNNFFSGDKVYRMAIGIAMSPLEHHFLSGAKNLIDVLHDPQGKGAPKAMINQAVGTASQFTNPSILRTVRGVLGGIKSFGGTPEGNSPMLDTYNSMDGKMAQFVPFYMGFNQPSLNVLGDPITKRPTDALTDRWLFSSTTPPDTIISPLVNNGLFIPGPKKSASVMIDDKGTLKTLNDAGDEAWRAYVIARGSFLKQVLTPNMVDQLTKMDRLQAQSILDGPGVNSAASHYAKSVVEDMIFKKKIKLNG